MPYFCDNVWSIEMEKGGFSTLAERNFSPRFLAGHLLVTWGKCERRRQACLNERRSKWILLLRLVLQ